MLGKRIFDALALLNVSRNIALHHFDIRFSQVKIYGQSSSIVKAVRKHGLPILATSVSRFASSTSPPRPPKEGIQQDHFYSASEQNSPAQSFPDGHLDVEQVKAQRHPLPDGTIPPQNSPIGEEKGDGMTFNKRPAGETPQHPVGGNEAQELSVKSSNRSTIPNPASSEPLSPNQARKLQRQSEAQIPTKSAEPPTVDETDQEFGVEQEQDVFYQPPDSVTPVLSALPRVRVPESENDVQEGDSHIPPGLNADVYYSGSKRETADEPSAEQLSQLFQSPRNANLFEKKAKYAPGGVGSRPFHTMRVRRQKASDTDLESLKQLTEDMGTDAQKMNVSHSKSSQAISTDQLTRKPRRSNSQYKPNLFNLTRCVNQKSHHLVSAESSSSEGSPPPWPLEPFPKVSAARAVLRAL